MIRIDSNCSGKCTESLSRLNMIQIKPNILSEEDALSYEFLDEVEGTENVELCNGFAKKGNDCDEGNGLMDRC